MFLPHIKSTTWPSVELENSAMLGPIKMIYSCLDKLKHTVGKLRDCLLAPEKLTFLDAFAVTGHRALHQLNQSDFLPWSYHHHLFSWSKETPETYVCTLRLLSPSERFPPHASWFTETEIRHLCNWSLSTHRSLNGCMRWPDLGKLCPFREKKNLRVNIEM